MQKAVKRYMPIFVLPTFCAFILGFIIPFIMGIWLSFCKFTTVTDAKFIGFSNYKKAFEDTVFRHSFWYTALFAVASLIIINAVAFALASALTKNMRGTNIFRTIFFMPNLIGGIVLGYIWQLIFNGILEKIWNCTCIKRMVRILGTDHSCKLAADWLYDDHLYCRSTIYSGGCYGSGTDRWCRKMDKIIQSHDSNDDAIHYHLYVLITDKRI